MTANPAISVAAPEPEIKPVKVAHAYDGHDVSLCYAYWAPVGALKDTVVAVHGLTRQKRDFDYIARFLAQHGYAVYAVDAPGRGGSDWMKNPDDYSLWVFADIFAAFLKQMGFSRIPWIGTSMGGLLALTMAMKSYGHYFKSVTLIDITHKPNRAALDRIIGYLPDTLPVLENPKQYENILRQNLPLGDVPDEVWGHYAAHMLKKVPGGWTFHFDPKMVPRAKADLKTDIDIAEGVKKLECPLALVAGGVSDLCTPKEIEDLRALRPDLKLHVVPKAGHVPALTDDATQQFILEQVARS